MATAALRVIRRALPEAYLAFAVGSWSRPAISGNPHIDALVDLGTVGLANYSFGDHRNAVKRLREGRFDTAFVLDRAPLITLLPFLAGIKRRIGLDSRGRGFSLSLRVPARGIRHEAELYLDVARAAGYEDSAPTLEFFPSDADAARIVALPALSSHFSSDLRRPLVAVHPGGGVNPGMRLLSKRWPVARFAAVIDRLAAELGALVLVVGGPDERGLAAEVSARVHSEMVDLVGALSWGELGALLRSCCLLLANDTGAAHLATAVGTPAVVLFGPTDPAQYGPFGLGQAVAIDLPCRPCFNNGRIAACHFSHRCLNELDVEVVWAAILRQARLSGTIP